MLQYLQWGADWLVKMLRDCPHHPVQSGEGKFVCQSCGQGIIARWVVLRCCGCDEKRNSRYWMRRILPVEKWCPTCGERKVRMEFLENPSFFKLRQALLILQSEQEYLQSSKPVQSQTRAWIDAGETMSQSPPPSPRPRVHRPDMTAPNPHTMVRLLPA